MSSKRKLIYAIIAGLILLGVIGYAVSSLFLPKNAANEGMYGEESGMVFEGANMNMGAGMVTSSGYELFQAYPQDPVSLSGTAQLQTDTSYFYNAEFGKIDTINVTDGQMVQKGDLLFTYYSDKNKYDLEDIKREQTKLYNQREELVKQLTDLTGAQYNYQGDQVSVNWSGDGKSSYIVEVPIGTSYASSDSEAGANSAMMSMEDGGGAEGIKSQIRTLNNQITEVEIKLVRAQDGQYQRVIADFAGKAIVDPNGQYNTSTPLVRVVSDEVSVVGQVSEYEFYALGKDRAADLLVSAENRSVQGTMIQYDTLPRAASTNNGSETAGPSMGGGASGSTYQFSIKPDDYIQPGFSVKISLQLPGIVIPQSSIIQEGEEKFVFISQEGVVSKQPVKIGYQGTNTVALSGVEAGQYVVTMPDGLTDGQVIDESTTVSE